MVASPRPINWKNLRSDEAEELIRKRAVNSKNVSISMHAYDRLEECSSITSIDVYRILKQGYVVRAPQKNKSGDWEVTVQKKINGGRDVAAVTIVFKDAEKLKVKTVMWIDL